MSLSDKVQGGLTIDKIIEKFIPVAGVLFFVVGLGYLLYNSVWIGLNQPIKLGLGFFLSVVIIGGGLSLSNRLSYYADVVIGGGILLLYGTLIYGSRTTEIGSATIPENASIITSSLFTIAAAYFASLRKSKVILALVLIGAYLTPFVIGGEWGTSTLSFNTYLLYFFVANVTIFLLGKEVAIHDLIPLNMIGMLVGSTSLYALSYKEIVPNEFLSSSTFSAMLFAGLVIFSVFAIIFSSQKFESQYEGYLTGGYLVPLLWFIFNISLMGKDEINSIVLSSLYGIIALTYFAGWYILRNMTTRYQHVALYVGGIIALIAGFFTFFPELTFYSSLIIGYGSLVFGLIYMLDSSKGERIMAYWLFAGMGGILGLYHLHNNSGLSSTTFWTFIALLPAVLAYPITWKTQNTPSKNSTTPIMKAYSLVAISIILLTLFSELLEKLSAGFVLFIFPAFLVMVYAAFASSTSATNRGHLLRISIILLTIGFVGPFLYFLQMLIPHQADHLTLSDILGNSSMISGYFAIATLFIGLYLSRRIQSETNMDRPSFLLVIFGYTVTLLVVNSLLIVGMNDMGISTDGTGGPRAIAITFWWVLLAVWMISVGVIRGPKYRSEKLLGLLLLALTAGKIILYDMSTMSTNNKVVVLMVVGGALMLFSYFFHSNKKSN